MRQKFLGQKIWAKWESGLTTVELKWDPPVLLQVSMTCHQPVGQADVLSDVPPSHHPHMSPQCSHVETAGGQEWY